MATTEPVQNLNHVPQALLPEELKQGDPYYTDLSGARGSKALRKLELSLEQAVTTSFPIAHYGFIGHRGSGKSTELKRIAYNLREHYHTIHLELDGSMQSDLDYPDLLLWMVGQIAEQLTLSGIRPPKDLLNAISSWFATVTQLGESQYKAEIIAQANTEVSAAMKYFGTGFKMLAGIKSAFTGSSTFRKESRQEIKMRSEELISLVNTYLVNVQNSIGDKKLLIIQDNLDRLDRDSALALFEESGGILRRLGATFIWTAPVGSLTAPFNISSVFDSVTFMPMVSLILRDKSQNKVAIEAFKSLLGKRLSLQHCLADDATVEALILTSGGSVRDLLKLTNDAVLEALVEEQRMITLPNIQAAAKSMGLTFQRALFPHTTYFKILADLHLSQSTTLKFVDDDEIEDIDGQRSFFHELIISGAIFAYNGDSIWYNVHPSLLCLSDFQKALKHRKSLAS